MSMFSTRWRRGRAAGGKEAVTRRNENITARWALQRWQRDGHSVNKTHPPLSPPRQSGRVGTRPLTSSGGCEHRRPGGSDDHLVTAPALTRLRPRGGREASSPAGRFARRADLIGPLVRPCDALGRWSAGRGGAAEPAVTGRRPKGGRR